MSQEKRVAFINKLENDKHFIGSCVYRKYDIWPLLKLAIKAGARTTDNETETVPFFEKIKQKVSGFILFISSLKYVLIHFSVRNNYTLPSAPFLFAMSNQTDLHLDTINGKKYSRYIDPYFEALSGKYKCDKIVWNSSINENNYFIRARNVNVIPFLIYQERFNYIIKYLFFRNDKKVISILKYINQKMREDGFTEELKISQFIYFIDQVFYYKLFFQYLLSKKNRIIFLSAFYDDSSYMGLIAACRTKQIKTIDIQHGASTDEMYNNYQNENPGLSCFLPDYFWAWSIADTRIIQENNKLTKHLIPFAGGNMWASKHVNNQIQHEPVFNELVNLCAEFKRKILISLQPRIDVLDLLKAVIRYAPADWIFLIRFHPLMSNTEKIKIRNETTEFGNVEIDRSSAVNNFSILKLCDYQLTGSSIMAVEALSFRRSTIFCHSTALLFFKNYIDAQKVFYSENEKRIVEIINLGIQANFSDIYEDIIIQDPNCYMEFLNSITIQ